MTCENYRDWLDAYVDESCTPEQLAAIEDHLQTCPACTAEALARLQLKRATRAAAAARFTPSPEFRLRIEKTVQKSRKPLSRTTWILGLASSIALVFIAVSVMALMQVRERNSVIEPLAELHYDALASTNPVDVVSSDRHTVKPWFQGKLPYTFNLPELKDSPFKLLGGKLIFFQDSPAAQLLFEVRKHQISVFILQDQPKPARLPAAVTTSSFRGYSVETWSQSGLRYVVIGDTNAADLHALADLLRAAGQP